MAELWCNPSVPPAPGKGVKDEQGLRGQDGLEKGSELGGGSPAAATQVTRAFALVCCLVPRSWQWWDTGGPQGWGQKAVRVLKVSARLEGPSCPSWAETSAFMALSSLELPTVVAQGARAQ